MIKKISVHTGFLPKGTIQYSGEYVYKCKAVREGAGGLGSDFPQPEFIEDLELEGVGGINGKIEKTKSVNLSNPLNGRIHKYYLLEHDVWIRHLGDMKYISDWTSQEVWALVCEDTYDDEGNLKEVRDLGFVIIHSDRSKGILV